MTRRMQTAAAGIVLLGAGMAACGGAAPAGSAQASPQASTSPAASSPSPSAQPASTPPPADPIRATAVDSARLIALIPELPPWTRNQPRGEQIFSGVAISKAEAEYTNGDSTIKLTITDSTFDRLLMAPLAMSLMPKYSERSADGYKKYAAVGGHPGFESWLDTAQDAEVTVVVANRFIVNARGLSVTGIEPVRALVKKIDLKTLAAMK